MADARPRCEVQRCPNYVYGSEKLCRQHLLKRHLVPTGQDPVAETAAAINTLNDPPVTTTTTTAAAPTKRAARTRQP